MGRLRCATSAQRFLSVFSRTWNLFRPNRRSSTAAAYRTTLQDRFVVWQAAAGLRAYATRRLPTRASGALIPALTIPG